MFKCPYCGSRSFRPSTLRKMRDAMFRSFGLRPQRCYMCRARFYSFDLSRLRSWLAILEGPRPAITPVPPKAEAADAAGGNSNVVRLKTARNKRF